MCNASTLTTHTTKYTKLGEAYEYVFSVACCVVSKPAVVDNSAELRTGIYVLLRVCGNIISLALILGESSVLSATARASCSSNMMLYSAQTLASRSTLFLRMLAPLRGKTFAVRPDLASITYPPAWESRCVADADSTAYFLSPKH